MITKDARLIKTKDDIENAILELESFVEDEFSERNIAEMKRLANNIIHGLEDYEYWLRS